MPLLSVTCVARAVPWHPAPEYKFIVHPAIGAPVVSFNLSTVIEWLMGVDVAVAVGVGVLCTKVAESEPRLPAASVTQTRTTRVPVGVPPLLEIVNCLEVPDE